MENTNREFKLNGFIKTGDFFLGEPNNDKVQRIFEIKNNFISINNLMINRNKIIQVETCYKVVETCSQWIDDVEYNVFYGQFSIIMEDNIINIFDFSFLFDFKSNEQELMDSILELLSF